MSNSVMENNRLSDLLYYYRLKKDLELTEEKIEENKLIEIDENQNAIVKFWNKNVENFLRSDELKKYNGNKAIIEKKIKEFLESHNDGFDYDETIKEDKLIEYVNDQLKNDKTLIARTHLALYAILQNKEFIYKEESKNQFLKFCLRIRIKFLN